MKHTFPLYIFDMGGVVSCDTNVLPAIAAHLNMPMDEFQRWMREFGRDLMEDTLTTGDFWQMFSQRSGMTVREDLFSIFFRPSLNPDMTRLIDRLKARHRVVCGTNTITPHYAHHQERGDYGSFDAVYASHIMGIAKPRPEFYEHILSAEQVSASQVVFIDDALENVEAARQIGIHAIQFVSHEALVKDL